MNEKQFKKQLQTYFKTSPYFIVQLFPLDLMAIWTYLWNKRNHDFVLKEWNFKLISFLFSPPFNFFNFCGSIMFPQSWISFMHYCKMLLSKCLMRIAVGRLRVHVEHHFILGPLLLPLNSSISIPRVFFSWFEGLRRRILVLYQLPERIKVMFYRPCEQQVH